MMNLSIISAVSRNGAIGKNNRLPWKMPSDLRRFKELTGGHPLVLGQGTYISLPIKLEKRAVIVFSRKERPRMLEVRGANVFFTDSLEEIMPVVRESMPDISDDEIFIGGGEGIYKAFMPMCRRMYITEVHCDIVGADTFFPPIERNEWTITQELTFEPQTGDEYGSTFRVYERSR